MISQWPCYINGFGLFPSSKVTKYVLSDDLYLYFCSYSSVVCRCFIVFQFVDTSNMGHLRKEVSCFWRTAMHCFGYVAVSLQTIVATVIRSPISCKILCLCSGVHEEFYFVGWLLTDYTVSHRRRYNCPIICSVVCPKVRIYSIPFITKLIFPFGYH
jgi:hypothetical protein